MKGRDTTMIPRRRLLAVSVVALAVLLAPAGAAAASRETASGTMTTTSATFNGVRFAGGNTIVNLTSTVLYTGTFSGTSVLHGTLTFHPNGTANFHDIETFTGTVNGVPGTVTFNLNGSSDPELNVRGTAVVVGATGELAGMHGVLRQSAVVIDTAVGPVGTYNGTIKLAGG
jgi:hypothetical protein